MKPSIIRRLVVAGALGLGAGAVTGMLVHVDYVLLAGWDIFVLALVVQILYDFASETPDETAKTAQSEAMGHAVVDTIVVAACIVSLGAVVALITGKNAGLWHIVFGLASIVLSWVTVHVLFTLRYATLYYHDVEGGIDFNDEKQQRPRFSDFVYLAFTIGMTYQVSDNVITDYRIRRTVLTQALVSFVFGVVIIASTINFLISLAN